MDGVVWCGQDPMADVAALRKKYDELVAFTVQLTAQRDVLMTDLDKTYPPNACIALGVLSRSLDVLLASLTTRAVLVISLCLYDCVFLVVWPSTRQLLQKANLDAQRARKLTDDAASGATLRHRKPGGAAANGGAGSSDEAVGLKGHGTKDPAVSQWWRWWRDDLCACGKGEN